MNTNFKSGFINIIGLPNSGKSSLLNALIKEKMAIATAKPQTTRQRIFGIYNDDHHQLIISDTPGWIEETAYPLHKQMNLQIKHALEDGDLLLLVVDPYQKNELPDILTSLIVKTNIPVILCVNKSDLNQNKSSIPIDELIEKIKHLVHSTHYVSAKTGDGISELLKAIKLLTPVHPPYYPQDHLSDRSVRFFISELIREQIMLGYGAEIPYHCFVVVDQCKGVDDDKDMAVIDASIYVGRQSQVSILIGKKASKLKALGIESRKEIEKFLNQKVYLNLSVKLKKDWRDNISFIQKSGIFQ